MSEMIDRMVEAMAAMDLEDSAENYDLYEPYARAALTALEEPTEAMVEAGQARVPYLPAPQGRNLMANSAIVFSAMIAAAKGGDDD